MTPEEVRTLVTLDEQWRSEIRATWLELIDVALWGDLKGANVGAIPKVRKRILDLGEKWRSLFNSRDWIPQPREQIKNALASSANLRETLLLLERASKEIEGGADFKDFERTLILLHKAVVGPLRDMENQWAAALDAVNQRALEDDSEDN